MTVNVDLLKFFTKDEVEQLAKEKKFVIRKSPINGFNMLLTFTTGLLETANTTLMKLVAFLNTTAHTKVSPQALDKRIEKQAVEFLKVCLDKVMDISVKNIKIENELLSSFSYIYIIDSTNFSLHPSLENDFKGSGGSGSPASMRIQLVYDYLSGKTYLEIGDVKNTDAVMLEDIVKNNSLNINRNALFLQDPGYFNTNTFENIEKANNFFISKIKTNTKIFDLDGNKLDLKKITKKDYKYIDMIVKIQGKTFRLVGKKLSDKIVNQVLRKANTEAKKRGKTVTDEQRLFLSWGLFITNLGEEYSHETLYTLYRIRWQIELIFKSWKSILEIHKIQYIKKKERVLCEVYGKLIIAIIVSGIFYHIKSVYNENFSYDKILKYFSVIAFMWGISIMAGILQHQKFLESLIKQLLRFCKKNKQRNKPTIEKLLNSLSGYTKKEVLS